MICLTFIVGLFVFYWFLKSFIFKNFLFKGSLISSVLLTDMIAHLKKSASVLPVLVTLIFFSIFNFQFPFFIFNSLTLPSSLPQSRFQPSKADLDVLRAIDCKIDEKRFPSVHLWSHMVTSSQQTVSQRWV